MTGEGFGSGIIDLGGLQVCQITTFNKIWATYEGGPDNLGATFYEPSSIPNGYFMLGCYSQPNNGPLFGWILAGQDTTSDGGTLIEPTDYTLVWSSESLNIKQNANGYIWLPTPPNGYKAMGHVVTTSPEKPSLKKIRCVRSDLTDESEVGNWIWGQSTEIDENGFNVYELRPSTRGTLAQGVSVGTFLAQNKSNTSTNTIPLACLKNNTNTLSYMPNIKQIEALVQLYSPIIYCHPNETYLPSSVNWFFTNGALLYKKGDESDPVRIEPDGSNLPQGGSNDGEYWLDLPSDTNDKEKVMKGNLQSSKVYLHVKPMLGATFTDIVIWIFYPFNGPATAKLGLINVPLGRIGEHVGDWEHITLRISNFNGVLYKVYFSQHSSGAWVNSSMLQFHNASSNKFVAYSSLHGHANYSKPGLVMQGNELIGIRNDTDESDFVVDTGERYLIIAAENLEEIVEPAWVNYCRKWGPHVTYKLEDEIKKIEEDLPGELKTAFESLVDLIPNEVFEEDGPTGLKMKSNWSGDEI